MQSQKLANIDSLDKYRDGSLRRVQFLSLWESCPPSRPRLRRGYGRFGREDTDWLQDLALPVSSASARQSQQHPSLPFLGHHFRGWANFLKARLTKPEARSPLFNGPWTPQWDLPCCSRKQGGPLLPKGPGWSSKNVLSCNLFAGQPSAQFDLGRMEPIGGT